STGRSGSMNIALTIDSVQQEALPSASEAGPASKRIVVAYGFWIFLLSDIVMFAALLASYVVLVHASAGGPTGARPVNQTTEAIDIVWVGVFTVVYLMGVSP